MGTCLIFSEGMIQTYQMTPVVQLSGGRGWEKCTEMPTLLLWGTSTRRRMIGNIPGVAYGEELCMLIAISKKNLSRDW
jgi:hypothetical protein